MRILPSSPSSKDSQLLEFLLPLGKPTLTSFSEVLQDAGLAFYALPLVGLDSLGHVQVNCRQVGALRSGRNEQHWC